jgi:hypothetical protein
LLQRWNKSATKDSRENVRREGSGKELSILGRITELSKSLTRDRIDYDDRIKILILKFSYGNNEVIRAVSGMPWRLLEWCLWIE